MKSVPVTNCLLECLDLEERREILESCEPVDLVLGDILSVAGQPYAQVYFPLTACISLVIPTEGHQPMGLGMIGNEGMLGATLTLGADDAPLQALVLVSGTALRMDTKAFRQAFLKSPALLASLHQYLFALSAQLAQSVPCSHFHEVRPRLARWLLMTHDRAHADHFYLTHQFLSDMLGVQRSAITIAAGTLQKKGTISYVRGEIRIISRKKLEAASCECYRLELRNKDRASFNSGNVAHNSLHGGTPEDSAML